MSAVNYSQYANQKFLKYQSQNTYENGEALKEEASEPQTMTPQEWYEKNKERFSFAGEAGEYNVLFDVTREKAQEIEKQTAFAIPFAPGETIKRNHTIGSGAFGSLHFGEKNDGTIIGIKITFGENVIEEILIQRKLSNDAHIMPSLDHKELEEMGLKTLLQVMPVAGLGSVAKLFPFIHRLKDPQLIKQITYLIAKDALQGLKAMHQKKIYHLDLKPDNTVIDGNGKLKLIDFGCSKERPDGKTQIGDDGDRGYFSPERLKKEGPCDAAKVDIWALGCFLAELYRLGNPYEDIYNDTNLGPEAIEKKLPYTLKNPSPGTIEALIKSMLEYNPQKRPTALDALNDPWMKSMEATAPTWEKETRQRLLEIIQSQKRGEKPPTSLSPQDLPYPHFINYIVRKKIQEEAAKRLSTNPQGKIVPLCGGGGTGKSTLATRIIHLPQVRATYEKIFYFRLADEESHLNTQYSYLAQELGLVPEKTPPEKAKKALEEYLKTHRSLLVFDNADLKVPLIKNPGGGTLITTRDKFPEAIPVGVMSPEEALQMIQEALGETENALQLAETLGFLPLALGQALAYIRNENISIATYLKALENEPGLLDKNEELIGMKLPASIASMWSLSLKKLSKEAQALLDQLAYLSPDPIPLKVLEKLGRLETEKELERYAILENRQIHRLLQLYIRGKHNPSQKEKALLKAMEGVRTSYVINNKKTSDYEENSQLRTHIESLIQKGETQERDPLQPVRFFSEFAELWAGFYEHSATEGNLQEALKAGEKALYYGEKGYGKESPELGVYLYRLGSAWSELGDYNQALDYQTKALASFEKKYGMESSNVAAALGSIGSILFYQGKYNQALEYLKRSLAIEEKIHGRDHSRVAQSLDSIGFALNTIGEYEKALEYHVRALAIQEKVYDKKNPAIAKSLSRLGRTKSSLGKYQEALKDLERSLAILEETYGKRHFSVGILLNDIGNIWNLLGDYEKALEYYQRALVIIEKTYGNEHPEFARSLNDIGSVWIMQGDSKKALDYHQRALVIREKTYGENHPTIAISLSNIGRAWFSLGDFQKSQEYHNRSLLLFKKIYGEEHIDVAVALGHIGHAWSSLGDYNKALEFHQKSLAIKEKVNGRAHLNFAITLEHIGKIWSLLKDYEKALKYYESALDIYEKIYGKEHSKVVTLLKNIGEARSILGDSKKV